jgi:hypothetical protein
MVKVMQLHDNLQVCLLALISRYPEHVLDINEELIGTQQFGADGWSAFDLIEMLEETAPHLLRIPALLIINPQKSELYLLDYSEEIPAMIVHSRGKLPPLQGGMILRKTRPLDPTSPLN